MEGTEGSLYDVRVTVFGARRLQVVLNDLLCDHLEFDRGRVRRRRARHLSILVSWVAYTEMVAEGQPAREGHVPERQLEESQTPSSRW